MTNHTDVIEDLYRAKRCSIGALKIVKDRVLLSGPMPAEVLDGFWALELPLMIRLEHLPSAYIDGALALFEPAIEARGCDIPESWTKVAEAAWDRVAEGENLSAKSLSEILWALAPFRLRDDTALKAVERLVRMRNFNQGVWVEDLALLLLGLVRLGHFSAECFNHCLTRARDVCRNFLNIGEVHDGLIDIAWSFLLESPDSAWRKFCSVERIVEPTLLSPPSLRRVHQIVVAAKKGLPEAYRQLVPDALQMCDIGPRWTSEFHGRCSQVVSEGMVPYNIEAPCEGFRVGALLNVRPPHTILEFEDYNVHHLRVRGTDRFVRQGTDFVRESVFQGAGHQIIRLSDRTNEDLTRNRILEVVGS